MPKSFVKVEQEECDQIWWNFATETKFKKVFGHFLSNYLVFGIIVNIFRQMFYSFGQFFINLNDGGQVAEWIMSMWSKTVKSNLFPGFFCHEPWRAWHGNIAKISRRSRDSNFVSKIRCLVSANTNKKCWGWLFDYWSKLVKVQNLPFTFQSIELGSPAAALTVENYPCSEENRGNNLLYLQLNW